MKAYLTNPLDKKGLFFRTLPNIREKFLWIFDRQFVSSIVNEVIRTIYLFFL